MNRTYKNIILIIAALITLVCVLEGTSRHLSRGIFGRWNLPVIHLGSRDDNRGEGSVDSAALGEVKDIQLDLSLGDVKICHGSENRIDISCNNEKMSPQYSLENGRLKVWQNGNTKMNDTIDLDVSVTITVKDTLNSLSGTLDLGDGKITNIDCDTMNLTLDLGDLKIEGGKVRSLTLKNDLGNAEIHKVDFDSADLRCSLGNLEAELLGEYSDYTMDLEVSLGDLSVGDQHAGEHYSTGGGSKTIKAEVDLGNISIYR